MFRYLVRRFLVLIPTVFVISIIIFGIVKIMPGDPVDGVIDPLVFQRMTAEQQEELIARKRAELGLDKSLPEQYFIWAGNILKGEFGYSIKYNVPVQDHVGPYLVNSIQLNFLVIILAFLLAIPIGIKSAVKKYSTYDNFWQVFSLVGISLPSFFFAMILIFLFAVILRLFPISGMTTNAILIGDDKLTGIPYLLDLLWHMALPATVMIIGSLAGTVRYIRNAMLDVLSQDYIRTARSKGVTQKVIIYSHAFRNALIPVITLVAFSIPGLFGGATIIERMFNWPGIGNQLIQALNNRDYMIILTMNMFYAGLALLANVIMDVGYALVDPRIKLQ